MLLSNVIELPLVERVGRFFEVLRDNSTNKQDPISEWEYLYDEPNKGNTQKFCICSTKISNLHVIKNKLSGQIFEIGSECIKKWDLAPVCKSCGSAIGSLTKRRKLNDWLCRKCKKDKEREATIKQIEKEMLLKKLGRQIFYGYFTPSDPGPWYGKRFDEVVKDNRLVRITLKTEIQHDDYWSFREFLDLYRNSLNLRDNIR